MDLTASELSLIPMYSDRPLARSLARWLPKDSLNACSLPLKYPGHRHIGNNMQYPGKNNSPCSEVNFFHKMWELDQLVRKSKARADRFFLWEVAFFHLRKHKYFSPKGLLIKNGYCEPPSGRWSDYKYIVTVSRYQVYTRFPPTQIN